MKWPVKRTIFIMIISAIDPLKKACNYEKIVTIFHARQKLQLFLSTLKQDYFLSIDNNGIFFERAIVFTVLVVSTTHQYENFWAVGQLELQKDLQCRALFAAILPINREAMVQVVCRMKGKSSLEYMVPVFAQL